MLAPRIATSSLKNIYRNPSKLTFTLAAAAAATAAVVTVVSAPAAAAGSGSGMSAPRVAALAVHPPMASVDVYGTRFTLPPGHGGAAARSAGDPAAGHAGAVQTVARTGAAGPNAPAAASHGARHAPAPAVSGPCHASQVYSWICQAESVMIAHGTPSSLVNTDAGYIVVMHESGGNPQASNGWDSNAAAGTPSEGIAQIIPPGFATYHLPGHDNIWNPVDNMIAAFRYAISRYGSMNNIPGVVAVRSGGSYVGY